MIGSTIFHEKKKQPYMAKLSLISLMDIFTILVFFLLMNSGDSDTIETAKFVELPDSSSGIAPHTDLQIIISDDEIRMGDKVIALVTEVLSSPERVIEPLATELEAIVAQRDELSAYEKDAGLPITISGDRSVSYALLTKVMTTCQQSNYRNISLAVNQVGGDAPVELMPHEEESSLIVNRAGGVD